MKKSKEDFKKLVQRFFPWDVLFAERSNFEWGYFVQEGRYAVKYLPQRPAKILVIGSGNGREARPICRQGHKIVCMDIGLGYLISGKKLCRQERARGIYFIQADLYRLPFAKESFNFIFFTLYSSCKKRRFAAMRDILKMLRPTGRLLMAAVTPRYLKSHPFRKDWAIIASEEQLRQEVSTCGFTLLESAVDPERPEYRFSVLKAKTGKSLF